MIQGTEFIEIDQNMTTQVIAQMLYVMAWLLVVQQ
jgi:hypothetical protein